MLALLQETDPLNGAVIDFNTALTEHFFKLSIANPIFAIPTYSPDNHVIEEVSIFLKIKRNKFITRPPIEIKQFS